MRKGFGKRQFFSAEFRASAVDLCLSSDKSVAKTARDLGVKEATLYRWVKMSKQSTNKTQKIPEQSEMSLLKKENLDLRKQLASVQEEAEILKKCIAFFAKK